MIGIDRLWTGARRARLLVGAASALLGLSLASAAFAAPPVAFSKGTIKTKVGPMSQSDQLTNYIVELADAPVSAASADAASPMSRSQKQQLAQSLRSQQNSVANQAKSLGGTVLASYQYAYNGIKVRIPAKQAAALAALPGVVGVHRAQVFKPNNTHGVPLIGGPAVWGGVPGYRGENVKVAIIDTGIDYTHADFGGPGTPAAYQAALAVDTADADPALFGPSAPKVKGGTDLVGDSYNADPSSASYQPTPHPDSNPLDCNSHGTHVAGTAAGYGVLLTGETYTGAYDTDTVSANSWLVGPGVAPAADLYAVRVFGCTGSTDVVVDAIEWAVANDMDVINMSLGSSFGAANTPDAVAAQNAVKAGVIVIASAGNAGAVPYIVGSPSTGKGVVSVAASDPTEAYPGADIILPGGTLSAINANGASFSDGLSGQVVVVQSSPGVVSLGCAASDYTATAGKIAVVVRGSCSRVARAIYGQQAGAIAVVMINNADSLPPYEGPITTSAETGDYTVTIPFLGTTSSTKSAWLAADGTTATVNNKLLANPGYLAMASFTSQGPGVSGAGAGLKPAVTAPGVSISSAGMGTGNANLILSGTSMAAPHTTGASVLIRQAHPSWKRAQDLSAALVNTTDPALVAGYVTRLSGGGLVQALPATQTDVIVTGAGSLPSLDFGTAELLADFSSSQTVTLKNLGSSAATFAVSVANVAGSPHSATPSTPSITVPAGGKATLTLQLDVPAATAGDSSSFRDVSGLLTFTPNGASNNGVTLRIPYYMVPLAASSITTSLKGDLVGSGSAKATTRNSKGVVAGAADWYALGAMLDKPGSPSAASIRAVGVQAFSSGNYMGIAIATYKSWSAPQQVEYDVYIDADSDGTDDYVVYNVDYGLATTGAYNGQMATVVVNLHSGAASVQYLADAPLNSSTLVLSMTLSQLCTASAPCVSAAAPRFTYRVYSFDTALGGSAISVTAAAKFNPYAPAVGNGYYDVVEPGATAVNTVSYNAVEQLLSPALGFLVISHDNVSKSEAQLIPLSTP
jgi:minor extracellular serine protease Vpr